MPISVRKFKETIELGSPLIRRLRCHKYFPVAVLAVLVLAAAVTHIWQRVVVISLVKEVSHLRVEHRSILDDARKLNSQIARLSMSSRIEQVASDSLNLHPVSADRMFTLVPDELESLPPDELSTMFSSIKRVASYLPAITPNEASAQELQPRILDSQKAGPGE